MTRWGGIVSVVAEAATNNVATVLLVYSRTMPLQTLSFAPENYFS